MRVAKDTTVGTARTFGRYRHDGQTPIEDRETRTEWPRDSFALVRYAPGPRGVDLIERTTADVDGNTPPQTITGFPIYDAHGNDVATLTRNGSGGYNVGDRRSYDAWGTIRAQDSAGDPTLRYCANLGHKADDESGLVYMRARYYDPAAGRFVSEDPAMHGGNWFVYCDNSPLWGTDDSGCFPEPREGHTGAYFGWMEAGLLAAALACAFAWKALPGEKGLAMRVGAIEAFCASAMCFDNALNETDFNSPVWFNVAKAPAFLVAIATIVMTAMNAAAKLPSWVGKAAIALEVLYTAMVCGALVGALEGD